MTDHSFEDMNRRVDRLVKNTTPDNMKEPLGSKDIVCPDHGNYTSTGIRFMGRREIWTPCPDCEERRLANERQAKADAQAEEARLRMERLINEALIPKRFIGRSLDNFKATTPEQAEALRITREFVENFDSHAARGSSLIFSGLPGTGKSHLATAALQAIMPRHCGLYTTCMNVIRSVRGTWRKDSEMSETQMLNVYAELPLLVLDEIGVQYGTDGEQTILFDVLDRRYRDMLPSIFLTNQDKKGFKEFIGERTFDRLTETSRWVAFDWPSYRPTARKEQS